MKILVVRNDKLGDFMLAWPTFALLKQQWPEATLCALVPEYTRPMAELCPWIDEVLIEQRLESSLADILSLRHELRQARCDAMITLFSTSRIAIAGCLAGIPYRLAPATKLAQLCYNHRRRQRRSRSEKPEYAYNLDLALQLLHDLKGLPAGEIEKRADNDYLPPNIPRPLLQFDHSEIAPLREKLFTQHDLPADTRLVFIHPGSGGSASTLGLEKYAQLAHALVSTSPLAFVISAGPGEEDPAQSLQQALMPLPATVLRPQNGLAELSRYLQLADLFISGSTGPLHIAAALDRPTAAFYPRHRSGSPLRWQTLNAAEKRLVFVPPADADEKDVASIDIAAAARAISEHLLKKP